MAILVFIHGQTSYAGVLILYHSCLRQQNPIVQEFDLYYVNK